MSIAIATEDSISTMDCQPVTESVKRIKVKMANTGVHVENDMVIQRLIGVAEKYIKSICKNLKARFSDDVSKLCAMQTTDTEKPGTTKSSCMSTALNRWSVREMRWHKDDVSRASPVAALNRRPTSVKKCKEQGAIAPRVSAWLVQKENSGGNRNTWPFSFIIIIIIIIIDLLEMAVMRAEVDDRMSVDCSCGDWRQLSVWKRQDRRRFDGDTADQRSVLFRLSTVRFIDRYALYSSTHSARHRHHTFNNTRR